VLIRITGELLVFILFCFFYCALVSNHCTNQQLLMSYYSSQMVTLGNFIETSQTLLYEFRLLLKDNTIM